VNVGYFMVVDGFEGLVGTMRKSLKVRYSMLV
jgi:hypothetical protein